ncbi:60S ribosomal protein L28 [Hondaea fermentalgiana]|uniref:60S ribosomal protein L28 n=1 Tax=Hondaea fermentalgiana TaxID=2315210 RepID=A0A2R5GHU5_9STRA|nr:60S ribosomal protein L28 [Hondaea fermentalgiana]|eukprot:GBG30466.1 60S ribosomal protein L28 [Hondaea fermentalgiana]
MVKLSDNLLWQLTKGSNAFTVKAKGCDGLTREPFNITNEVSPKTSGLANSKAVGMVAGDKPGNLKLTLKTRSADVKPARAAHTAALRLHAKGFKKTAPTVKKLLEENYYREDLSALALKRLFLNAKANSRKAAGKTYKAKPRSNKA